MCNLYLMWGTPVKALQLLNLIKPLLGIKGRPVVPFPESCQVQVTGN